MAARKPPAPGPPSPDKSAAPPVGSRPKRLPQQELSLHWERVPGLARKQLNLFISLEPKVLRGDNADAIHDLRVASRRLQQTLDLLFPKPRPPKIRKLRRTIRRARRALSIVRNCDVLLARAERALARKRLARREVWTAFRDYLQGRRESSFRKATRKLGTLNLSSFYLRLKSHLESSGIASAGSGEGTAESGPLESAHRSEAAHRQVARALEQCWTALEECLRQSQEEPATPALHPVRIAAKRLRYLMEAMADMGAPGSKQALGCLRRLQQHLGDWHDLEVMEEVMLEMVARPEFLQSRLELALQTERLVLQSRRAKKRYEEKFFEIVQRSPEWARLEGWVRSALPPEQPAAPESAS